MQVPKYRKHECVCCFRAVQVSRYCLQHAKIFVPKAYAENRRRSKERYAEYINKPGKRKMKARHAKAYYLRNREKRKAYCREYYKRPHVKEKLREYYSRSEVKARCLENSRRRQARLNKSANLLRRILHNIRRAAPNAEVALARQKNFIRRLRERGGEIL